MNCVDLTSVAIENGVTIIQDRAFYGCSSLTSVIIPDSVTSITQWAFGECGKNDDGKFWIYGIPGSYAETFANERSSYIRFIGISEIPDASPIITYIDRDTMQYEAKAEWDDALFTHDPSDEKNYPGTKKWKDLAVVSSVLSGSAYRENLKHLSENYEKIGLKDIKLYNEKSDVLEPGYAFGHKTIIRDGKEVELVVAVFRGTEEESTWEDWAIAGSQMFEEINTSAGVAYFHIDKYLKDYNISAKNAFYLITGHSLGGAMANCVAASLSDYVDDSRVFGFTFASPKTVPANLRSYNNISNFISTKDTVVYLGPEIPASARYGKNYFVSVLPALPSGKSHKINSYIPAVKAITKTGKMPKDIKIVIIQCPVDIEVYDDSNTLVGEIVNNKVTDNTITPAYVEGENKYFFLPDDIKYSVKLLGTDDGTMDLTVVTIDPKTENPIAEMKWENVALFAGKEMVSEVGKDILSSDVKLFVTENGQIIEEIEGYFSYIGFVPGRIIANDKETSIFDALEILKFLVGMDGEIINGGSDSRAWNAALITKESQDKGNPTIFDALEILKYLVGMDNLI